VRSKQEKTGPTATDEGVRREEDASSAFGPGVPEVHDAVQPWRAVRARCKASAILLSRTLADAYLVRLVGLFPHYLRPLHEPQAENRASGSRALPAVLHLPAPKPLRAGEPLKLVSLDEAIRRGDWSTVVRQISEATQVLERTPLAKADAPMVAHLLAQTYLLQQRTIGAVNAISRSDARLDHDQALTLLQRLGDVLSRGFERATAIYDQTHEPVPAWRVLRNTFKQPGYHSESERIDYYLKKLQAFLAKGGKLEDILAVTPQSVASMPSGVPYEFAVNAYGASRMARSDGVTPGHVVLAGGEDVLSAGTLVRYGDIWVVGTFSGHFRTEQEDLAYMKDALVKAGVPPENIILQSGEAGTPRAVEVALSAAPEKTGDSKPLLDDLVSEASTFNAFIQRPAPKAKSKPDPAAEDRLRRQNLALFQLDEAGRALDASDRVGVDRLIRTFELALEEGIPAERVGELTTALGRLLALLSDPTSSLAPESRLLVEAAVQRFGSTAPTAMASRVFGPRNGATTRLGVTMKAAEGAGAVQALAGAGAGLLLLGAGEDPSAIAAIRGSGHVLQELPVPPPAELPKDIDGFVVRGADIEHLAALRFELDRQGSKAALILAVQDETDLERLHVAGEMVDGLVIDRAQAATHLPRTEVPALEQAVLHEAKLRGLPAALLVSGTGGPMGLEASGMADLYALARNGFDAVLLDGGLSKLAAVEQATAVLRSADSARLDEGLRAAAARIAGQEGS